MNKPKQLQFIAILLLAFALSLTLAPICHAQVEGDSGSDEIGSGETDTESGGSGSDTVGGDTDSDQPGTGAEEAGTGSTVGTSTGRPAVSIFQAAGPNPAPPDTEQSIQSTVDAFRAALGEPNNGNAPGPLMMGRREINWDGGGNNDTTDVPSTPFNVFLNIRGAQFITPGTGLSQGPPAGLGVLFSNPTYSFTFSTFSPLRLFTPVGSNITHALFFVPGTNGASPALVQGFGAVFTDVDQPNGSKVRNDRSRKPSTFIEYYGANDRLLFRGIVPSSPGTANISFFGVVFDSPIIARVRIITGNSAPGPNDGRRDIVMMDDFIYGEPQMAP
jgi:hypothetical protein